MVDNQPDELNPAPSNYFENIVEPAGRRIALRVTPAAQRHIRQGHPWLFDQSIESQSHAGKPGDLAVVFDSKRQFLAVGLYDPTSPIRVRILQHRKPMPIDAAWFQMRLKDANDRRAVLEMEDTNGYRLVHGENDGLPGLIVDRYADTLVIKLYSVAWVLYLKTIASVLQKQLPIKRIVLRLSRLVQQQEPHLYGLRDGQTITGKPLKESVVFQENGLNFESDPVQGQKTGFFLDQRENRARVERLAEGQDVLDCFCCTGGFSLYAARGGAHRIVSVDSSQPALAAAVRNFGLNQSQPAIAAADHELLVGDAFMTLRELKRTNSRFGVVILDPPAFANSQDEVEGALNAYRRLVKLGLSVLRPGGIFVMASCSSRVTPNQFFDTILAAAESENRPLQELERTGHGVDHPISFREGTYLKCLFAVAP